MFILIVVLVSFGVGCLGAAVIFCNLSAVRSRRPDFTLLVFICLFVCLFVANGWAAVRLRYSKFELCDH